MQGKRSPYYLMRLLVTKLQLCWTPSVPQSHLALLRSAFPSEMSVLLPLHHLLLAFPHLTHPYGASSDDFIPFLSTQILKELRLLRVFMHLSIPYCSVELFLGPLAVILLQCF